MSCSRSCAAPATRRWRRPRCSTCTSARRWGRGGARLRWPSPSVRLIAHSPTRMWRHRARGSSRRCTRSGGSCVAEQQFAPASPRVLVAGATGFAGALAANLLWRHPLFDLRTVTARTEAGQRLDELYPRYRVPLELQELDLDRHGDVDAALVAYPHAASAPVVAALRARDVRVVDLSADFRLSERSTYERWYGPHPHPELLEDASYGLPELHRVAIAAAD